MPAMRPPKKAILATGTLTHTIHAIDASACPLIVDPPQRWALVCEETGVMVFVKTKSSANSKLNRLTGGEACAWGDYELDRARLLGMDVEAVIKQGGRSIRPDQPVSEPFKAGARARIDDFLAPVDSDSENWKRAVRAAVTRIDPDAIHASLIDQLTATKPIVVGGEIIEWPDAVARARATEFILSHGDGRPAAKGDLTPDQVREDFETMVSDIVEDGRVVRSRRRLRMDMAEGLYDAMSQDELIRAKAAIEKRIEAASTG